MFSSGNRSSNTRTATNPNYDMLRQPGVATTIDSGLARAGFAPTGGAIQQLQPQQQHGNIDPNNTAQRRLQPIQIQGGSLKTWTFPSPRVESVQVFLKTEGRPLNANVEVWQGPGTYCTVMVAWESATLHICVSRRQE
jgi:hypothetical protein